MAHHEVYIIIIRSPPLQHRSHVPAAVRSWRQAIWFQWAPKTGGQTKMPSDARGWQPPPREQAKDSAACSVRSRCCTSSPSTDNLCRTNRDDRTAPSSTCRHHHNRWLLVRQLTRRMFSLRISLGGFSDCRARNCARFLCTSASIFRLCCCRPMQACGTSRRSHAFHILPL